MTILDKDSCQHVLGVRQLLAGSRDCPRGDQQGPQREPILLFGRISGTQEWGPCKLLQYRTQQHLSSEPYRCHFFQNS